MRQECAPREADSAPPSPSSFLGGELSGFKPLPQHVPQQAARLAAEGVGVSARGEVSEAAVWQPSHEELYLR